MKKETKVNDDPVWVIEAIPRSKETIKETGYEKALLFVRKDINFIVRAAKWVDTGGYIKYFDVKKIEKIDGIYVGVETHVTKKKGKKGVHKTILKNSNIKFNQDLSEDIFTIRRLEKGL